MLNQYHARGYSNPQPPGVAVREVELRRGKKFAGFESLPLAFYIVRLRNVRSNAIMYRNLLSRQESSGSSTGLLLLESCGLCPRQPLGPQYP